MMTIPFGNNTIIELLQIRGAGAPWLVRVYRKRFFFKKLISSDWFLDGKQAKRFAEQLARETNGDSALEHLKKRRPGWVFRPALH